MLLDGRSLRLTDIERFARVGSESLTLSSTGLDRMRRSRETLLRVAESGRIYGMTTGVGANVALAVPTTERDDHGLRLLRSHGASYGPDEPAKVVRAAMLVRLNQLLVGASGVRVKLAEALQQVLASGAVPRVGSFGTIGTADLTQLADIGLTLAGEGSWLDTGPAPLWRPEQGEALALISSSAVTLARAALCLCDREALVRGARAVAALTFLALRGSGQAFAAAAFDPTTDPYATASAAHLRALLGDALLRAGTRLQDSISLRSFPQVDSVVRAAADRADEVVCAHVNSGRENPLVGVDGEVVHHGQFYSGDVAGALDALRAGDVPFAESSARRLATLLNARRTAVAPFLADGTPGSSGLMILEYVAADALGEVRLAGVNVPSATVVSDGIEDLASFAPHGVRLLERQTAAMRTVIAAELIAAVRLLRMAPERRPTEGPLVGAYATATDALPDDLSDRPLSADLALAEALLPMLLPM